MSADRLSRLDLRAARRAVAIRDRLVFRTVRDRRAHMAFAVILDFDRCRYCSADGPVVAEARCFGNRVRIGLAGVRLVQTDRPERYRSGLRQRLRPVRFRRHRRVARSRQREHDLLAARPCRACDFLFSFKRSFTCCLVCVCDGRIGRIICDCTLAQSSIAVILTDFYCRCNGCVV